MFPWGTVTWEDIVEHALFNNGASFRCNQTGMQESNQGQLETPAHPFPSSPSLNASRGLIISESLSSYFP